MRTVEMWNARRKRLGEEGVAQVINRTLNMRQERWGSLLAVIERDALKRLCSHPCPASSLLRLRASAALEH